MLIKDNHIRLAGGVARRRRARRGHVSPDCRSRSRRRRSTQVDEALAAGVRHHPGRQHAARRHPRGRRRARAAGRKIEISGGVTLERMPELADDRRRLRVGRRADALGAGRRHQLRDRTADRRDALPRRARRTRSRAPRASRSAAWRRTSCSFPTHRIDQRRRVGARGVSGDREGAVVIADAQTAGRGRRGRSVVFAAGQRPVRLGRADARHVRVPERDTRTTLLTLAAGVALAEGDRSGHRPCASTSSGRTICSSGGGSSAGILAEGASADGAVVLGYGINVGAAAYPPELADARRRSKPSSDAPVDRARVLAETLAALARRYDDLLDGRFDAILDAWRAPRRRRPRRRVSWTTPSGTQTGVTAGIDDAARCSCARRPHRAHRRRRSAWL